MRINTVLLAAHPAVTVTSWLIPKGEYYVIQIFLKLQLYTDCLQRCDAIWYRPPQLSYTEQNSLLLVNGQDYTFPEVWKFCASSLQNDISCSTTRVWVCLSTSQTFLCMNLQYICEGWGDEGIKNSLVLVLTELWLWIWISVCSFKKIIVHTALCFFFHSLFGLLTLCLMSLCSMYSEGVSIFLIYMSKLQ